MADLTLNDLTFYVDKKDRAPWDFSILDDPRKKIKVRQETTQFRAGSYSIKGFPQIIAERKTIDELLSCVGTSREQFESVELKHLLAIKHRCVFVETSLAKIRLGCWSSKVTPASVLGSVFGWKLLGLDFHFSENSTLACQDAALWMFIAARRIHRERVLLQNSAP